MILDGLQAAASNLQSNKEVPPTRANGPRASHPER
jgi:hypothetical protein